MGLDPARQPSAPLHPIRMRLSISLFAAALATVSAAQTDFRKDPTLYIVGYSHLDTEWCWTYRHSIRDFVPKTLRENFAMFERHPDYVFNWTGAKRYEFMKQYYPAEYARLKEYVRQGRWVVTGSGWDECDANVPSPESILRQVLYSNRFFRQEFGRESNNYLVPDVFGFPASLPSTLAHAGLKGMSTCKLSYYPDTSHPIPFNIGRWIGPDGASIVGALNAQSYHTRVKEDLSSSETILKRMKDQQAKSGLMLDYTYFGLGDEGGSPEPESIEWVEKSKKSNGPIRVIAKAADQMFDDLTPEQRAALPSYRGELLISKHSAGTATSGAAMKRWNHRNELLADAAERAAVAAQTLTGTPYPQARMTDAWQRFLGGQMHDILPGTSIPQAYTFAWNDQIVALNESADVVQASVGAVARQMDTQTKGVPVVVYNSLSAARPPRPKLGPRRPTRS
ncbi:alpha-mannosidase, partial [bacterium]